MHVSKSDDTWKMSKTRAVRRDESCVTISTVGSLKMIWDLRVFIQATPEGLTQKKAWNSIDRHKFDVVLSGEASNVTVRLNEAKFIVELCFLVKTGRLDPERKMQDKWDKITY